MSEEPKPCPFCAGKSDVDRWDGRYFGYCTQCGVSMNHNPSITIEDAIAKWNIRPAGITAISRNKWGALATVFMAALLVWATTAESSVHVAWLRLPMAVVFGLAALYCVYRYMGATK